ncbi:hypothetical protein GCM10027615_54180 [Plantactinospora veratri]
MQDKEDFLLLPLVEQFLTSRATRKPSPHTLAAYRRDLLAVAGLVADNQPGTPLPWRHCRSAL